MFGKTKTMLCFGSAQANVLTCHQTLHFLSELFGIFQVSLTAPKLCAKKFSGSHHFLGGRFVPPSIVDKFKLCLPPYPGTSMCVRIGKAPQVDISSMRENYISPEFKEEEVERDPFVQV